MRMNMTTSDDPDNDDSAPTGRLPEQAAPSGVILTRCETLFPVLSVERLEVDQRSALRVWMENYQ